MIGVRIKIKGSKITSISPLNALFLPSLDLFSMLGGEKEPAKEEEVTINFAFSSVVTIKKIKKGDLLSLENIWVKRPGTGNIKASEFDSLIGKKVIKDIPNNTQLDYNDFI